MICRHCQKSKVNRPRGLCWSLLLHGRGCATSTRPRASTPAAGVGNFCGTAPLPARVDHGRPGSAEKIAILAERAKNSQSALAPGRPDPGDDPGRRRGPRPGLLR